MIRPADGRCPCLSGRRFVGWVTTENSPAPPALSQVLELLLGLGTDTSEARRWRFLAGGRVGMTISMERCDWDSLHILTTRQAQDARDLGALVQLRSATMGLTAVQIMRGELSAAARAVEEERLIADATGTPPVATNTMLLAAWQGREQEPPELILATIREATARKHGYVVDFANCAGGALQRPRPLRRCARCRLAGLGAPTAGAGGTCRAGAGGPSA